MNITFFLLALQHSYQQRYFDLLQEFFEDDVVPYEICLFLDMTGKNTFRHSSYFYYCSISSDDCFIVSGSVDQTLKLWNIETGEEMKTFRGHSGTMCCCFISSSFLSFTALHASVFSLFDVKVFSFTKDCFLRGSKNKNLHCVWKSETEKHSRVSCPASGLNATLFLDVKVTFLRCRKARILMSVAKWITSGFHVFEYASPVCSNIFRQIWQLFSLHGVKTFAGNLSRDVL